MVTDILAALHLEKIYLKQLVINTMPNDAILDYLGSFSGLEKLELSYFPSGSADESGALARRFYRSVLPKHVKSIQVLKIQPCYEGCWCYNPEHVSILSQCSKLRSLSVCVPSTSVEGNGLRDYFDDVVGFSDYLRPWPS